MLFDDGRITPAPGSVELCDNGVLMFDTDLVDTVLITVEGKEAAIAAKRKGFEYLQDILGLQCRKCAVLIVRGSRHQLEGLVSPTMKTTAVKLMLLGILLITGATAYADEVSDMAAYEAEIVAWRVERLANLKAPFGFLNLVGLYWLEEGTSRIGSAADNDIVFPEVAAPYLAELG